MRVVVDLRSFQGTLHGIARYALELAHRIPQLAPGVELIGLTRAGGFPSQNSNIRPQIDLVPCSAPPLSLAEQYVLPELLLKLRPDVYHATSFAVPALWQGPLVATIHDATHLRYRPYRTLGRIMYYRTLVAPRIKRPGTEVVTVSNAAAREVYAELHLAEKPTVILNGVDSHFRKPSTGDVESFRRRHQMPPKYFAAIAHPKPHKNSALLRALAGKLPAPLAVVGTALSGVENCVTLPALRDEDLACWYGSALAFLAPSLHEGCDLPPLEAAACGARVVASDTPVHRELLPDTASFCNAQDTDQWLTQLLCPDVPQDGSVDTAGAIHERFNWDRSALQHVDVYRRVAGSTRPGAGR